MNPWNLTVAACHEPWRLWTCHLVHQDWRHAADNLLALAIPLLLVRRQERERVLYWLFLLSPILGLALIPSLDGGSYCGISGLACAAWAFVGLQLAVKEDSSAIGAGMLGLLALKFGVESMTGCGVLQHGGRWQAPSQSHLFGTLLGLGACALDDVERKLRSDLKLLITIPR